MPRALEVALIDVGGTLWPNSWPIRKADAGGRRLRIRAAMPGIEPATVEALADDLIESSRPGDEARTISTENLVSINSPAETLITGCLSRSGLPANADTIRRIRRAMSIPVSDRMRPLPGAVELLAAIHDLGMRNVIASNTYWRDADSYWEDFRQLGMAEHVDGIITSVDAGHLKPHPAVFEMAMRWAGVTAERCIVIGNREENDVVPALALGMRTILVYPDDPKPVSSRAHAVVPDLWACAGALRDMLDSHEG
ncbi:MAG: HAD family hydrolase [Chloroflexi bacterium]|nr:MAG: HAD family hydrolase [Chloroflexota bacterium]TME40893.1 MAG: HAD family hydrolase [Chloroflexota bacterium]